jgi:hypothetical protein
MRDGVSRCTSAWDWPLEGWLFESQIAGRTRVGLGDRMGEVGRSWVIHFRFAAFEQKPSVGFWPSGEFWAGLSPVNQRRLIAPIKQLTHGRPVGLSKHESPHCGFGSPAGSGPEDILAIAQKFSCKIAVGVLGLQGDSQGPERKKWQEVERPDTKASNGDERHEVNPLSEWQKTLLLESCWQLPGLSDSERGMVISDRKNSSPSCKPIVSGPVHWRGTANLVLSARGLRLNRKAW